MQCLLQVWTLLEMFTCPTLTLQQSMFTQVFYCLRSVAIKHHQHLAAGCFKCWKDMIHTDDFRWYDK